MNFTQFTLIEQEINGLQCRSRFLSLWLISKTWTDYILLNYRHIFESLHGSISSLKGKRKHHFGRSWSWIIVQMCHGCKRYGSEVTSQVFWIPFKVLHVEQVSKGQRGYALSRGWGNHLGHIILNSSKYTCYCDLLQGPFEPPGVDNLVVHQVRRPAFSI